MQSEATRSIRAGNLIDEQAEILTLKQFEQCGKGNQKRSGSEGDENDGQYFNKK